MRFGSVCSGIEAASVAWDPLGWKAAWFSEIEPFPCAVLAHHYPDVPNLGDMTLLPERVRAGEAEAPDVFCGGTPCQAFSVAGKRQSLDDARGNLSLVFCEIANAIDDVRSNAGTPPSIVFWENVPGVLSTKDNAFGCFLGELAGEDCPIEPTGGKWTNAGCVYGPKRAIAWRVLDAKYFGVAQRRRRVFVVASARDGFDPAAVLFEFEGLRRDTAPRRQTGQVAPTIPSRSTAGGGLGTDFDLDGGVITMAHGQGGAEIAIDRGPTLTCNHEAPIVTYGIPGNWIGRKPENGGNAVEPMHDVSPCLTKTDRHGVAQPMPINTMIATRHNALGRGTGFGIGEPGDPAYTIIKGHSHAVAQPVAYAFDSLSSNSMKSANPNSGCNHVDVSKTLDTSRGLDPSCNQGGIGVVQAVVAPSLTASNDPSRSPQSSEVTQQVAAVHAASMEVRRLTPVECERLQGFPDDYTLIPWRKKPASECPDGPRYKALGNSWAVPNVRWIGERIQLAVEVSA